MRKEKSPGQKLFYLRTVRDTSSCKRGHLFLFVLLIFWCLKPFQRFSLRAWSHPNVGQVHVQRDIKHGSKPGGETSFVSLGEQFSFKRIGRHVPVPVIQPWFQKSWDAVNNIKCFHLLYTIMCSTKCWTSTPWYLWKYPNKVFLEHYTTFPVSC